MVDKVALQVEVISCLPVDVSNTIFFGKLFVDFLLHRIDLKRLLVSELTHTGLASVDDFHLLAKFLNGFNFDVMLVSHDLEFGESFLLLFQKLLDFRLEL